MQLLLQESFMPKPYMDFNWDTELDTLVNSCLKIIQEKSPVSNFTRGDEANTSGIVRATLLYLVQNIKKLKKTALTGYAERYRSMLMKKRITIYLNDEMREAVQTIGDAIAETIDWSGLRFSRQTSEKVVYNHLLIFSIALMFFVDQAG